MIHTRRARIGIVGMGHFVYWPQFEGLVDELKQKQKIDAKYFRECEVVDLGFADDIDSSIVCLKKALAADLPLLAICRGCQALNVALGGTLVLDIDAEKSGDHFLAQQRMQVFTHRIEKTPGSRIERLLGKENRVNSYHHQCVDQPGNGVVITARDSHGVIECIEVPGREGFTLGVQWHPEGLALCGNNHLNIFKAFVEEAGQFQNRRNMR